MPWERRRGREWVEVQAPRAGGAAATRARLIRGSTCASPAHVAAVCLHSCTRPSCLAAACVHLLQGVEGRCGRGTWEEREDAGGGHARAGAIGRHRRRGRVRWGDIEFLVHLIRHSDGLAFPFEKLVPRCKQNHTKPQSRNRNPPRVASVYTRMEVVLSGGSRCAQADRIWRNAWFELAACAALVIGGHDAKVRY